MIYVYVLSETIVDDDRMAHWRSREKQHGYFGTLNRAKAAGLTRHKAGQYGHRWHQEAADHWVCGYFHIRKERVL